MAPPKDVFTPVGFNIAEDYQPFYPFAKIYLQRFVVLSSCSFMLLHKHMGTKQCGQCLDCNRLL